MIQLFIEAFIIGITLIIIGGIISCYINLIYDINLPDKCKEWNKHHIMEISLFLIGFTTHLLFEILGINKWYCKNSYACNNNTII